MKTTTLIFVIISTIFSISCRQQNPAPKSFEYIDMTLADGWHELVSFHVDSNKCIRIRIESSKGTQYIMDTLNDQLFFTLDSLSKLALTMNHDSISGEPIPDGGFANIIVKSKLKQVHNLSWARRTCCLPFSRLIDELYKTRKEIMTISTDTAFKFPSYWTLPPPEIEMVKFVPPVIDEK